MKKTWLLTSLIIPMTLQSSSERNDNINRCASPSVSAASSQSLAAVNSDEAMQAEAFLKNFLRLKIKDERKTLCATANAIRHIMQEAEKGSLPHMQALNDFNSIVGKFNDGNCVGLNSSTGSSKILREAGLTYTHRFHHSGKQDFVNYDVSEVLGNLNK